MQRTFSVVELRRQFASAFSPHPLIYWSDLLASAGIGWTAFALGARLPWGSLAYVCATTVAVLALLRAAVFIHEIAHFKEGALPGFVAGWHLLVGFPLLLPSLMYVGSHNDHHRQQTFGTLDDPEYAPLAHWSHWRILWFVLSVSFVPVLLWLRWGVVGPLAWLVPPLRRLLVARASTLAINSTYRRPAPTGKQALRWTIQEVAVSLTVWGSTFAVYLGWLPLQWVGQWYVVAVGVAMVNQVRTLAAHRYDNDGARLDAMAQLADSVTLRGWLAGLAAPVGLRFHALHHILPTVPYHSLGALHRRLLGEFSADSPYGRTQARGIVAAVRDLFRAEAEPAAAALTVNSAVREL
ncbi:MAG: fatty acid desaturase [Deltaproteobacteria bacterium]|nr:fatty acid desaturase [Deltaproteobacteria bacterium]